MTGAILSSGQDTTRSRKIPENSGPDVVPVLVMTLKESIVLQTYSIP